MATLTITTTAPQDVRLAAAFGVKLGLGRDATGPEIKAWIIAEVTQAVRDYEYGLQQAAINVAAFTPS